MRMQVAGFAMHRDSDLGFKEPVHLFDLVTARMARHMDEVIMFCNHLNTLIDQVVMKVEQRSFIAGDNLG